MHISFLEMGMQYITNRDVRQSGPSFSYLGLRQIAQRIVGYPLEANFEM
jgi:hypothetical protein